MDRESHRVPELLPTHEAKQYVKHTRETTGNLGTASLSIETKTTDKRGSNGHSTCTIQKMCPWQTFAFVTVDHKRVWFTNMFAIN